MFSEYEDTVRDTNLSRALYHEDTVDQYYYFDLQQFRISSFIIHTTCYVKIDCKYNDVWLDSVALGSLYVGMVI